MIQAVWLMNMICTPGSTITVAVGKITTVVLIWIGDIARDQVLFSITAPLD